MRVIHFKRNDIEKLLGIEGAAAKVYFGRLDNLLNYLGFYHQSRYGRPALALDMMEEFRPLIADATAITLFNKGEIAGYERRMEAEITHPLFGYTFSYRRILEVQSRLLSRVLSGEIKEYPAFIRR